MQDNASHTAHAAFLIPDAAQKAEAARAIYASWLDGALAAPVTIENLAERPGRPEKPELRLPADMPRRRKAGSLANRKALLHAIAHIELNAIDLALDMAVRFGAEMPREFTDDWLSVADDEARHFQMLNKRLHEFDSHYGALPAHDGLWQAAFATRHSLDARLAVVPMVLEARGLDVTPSMIERLEHFGDQESADILKIIYAEEVRHVAIGFKWFKSRSEQLNKDGEQYFQQLVTTYFHGSLKPPFNHDARGRANMPRDYYEPLADLL